MVGESDETESTLDHALDDVCRALRAHAVACQDATGGPRGVIEAGERLRAAVEAYERTLGEKTGWSSPLRHLDEPPQAEEAESITGTPEAQSQQFSDSQWIHVNARYYLRVDDAEGLSEYVKERLGISATGQAAAVQALYAVDGWKLDEYPAGLVRVDDSAVDVSVEE